MDTWPTWKKVDEYRKQLEAEYEDKDDETPETPKEAEEKVIVPVHVDGLAHGDTIVDAVVENDTFVLVVLRGDSWCLLVSDNATGDTHEFPHSGRAQCHAIYLNPSGEHLLLSLRSGENIYINTKEESPTMRVQERLTNKITAVAWDASNKRSASSGSILIGDARGTVFLSRLERGVGCAVLTAVFDVSSRIEHPMITGLTMQQYSGHSNRILVLIATTTRLYEFHGGPSLEDVFQKQTNISTHKQFVKLHAGPFESKVGLRTFTKDDHGSLGWCSSAGLYHATLRWPDATHKSGDYSSQYDSQDTAVSYNSNPDFNVSTSAIHGGSYFTIAKREPGAQSFMTTERGMSSNFASTGTPPTVPAPPPSARASASASRLSMHFGHQKDDVEKVLGLILGENTMTILFEDSLQIVAQPAGLRWRALNEPHDRIRPEELKDRVLFGVNFKRPVGLWSDGVMGTLYLITSVGVYEVVVPEIKSSQAWKSFLVRAMKEDEPDRAQYFVAASRLVKDDTVNEQIKIKAADFLFEEGHYVFAAEIYAETYAAFEDTALKLVHCGEGEALLKYLTKKIEYIKNRCMYWGQERSQLACLTTWTCKVFLDRIMSISASSADAERLDALKAVFHEFVKDNLQHIQTKIIHEIAFSYRMDEEVLFFASLTHDYRAAIAYYLMDANYTAILATLNKHCLTRSMVPLWYQVSSRLIQHVPVDLVSAWMNDEPTEGGGGAANVLRPAKLIPAILQYNVKYNPPGETQNQAVRYLNWVVQDGQSTDPAIHNLVIFLSASDVTKPEAELVEFLVQNQDDYYFDEKYALRVCLEHKRHKAAGHIYGLMGMWGDAIELCLSTDNIALAKTLAGQPSDAGLKKKLWLEIAQHVLRRDSNNAGSGADGGVRAVLGMLRESKLKLDDVLPYFGEDVLIADFSNEMWETLTDYNCQTEDLKRMMHDMTHDAARMNSEIDTLRQRQLFLQNDSRCKLCFKPILGTGSFYAFPLCKEEFHQDCLRQHVTASDAVSEDTRMRILELHEIVQSCALHVVEGNEDPSEIARAREAKQALDLIVADQCPCCGDLKIQEAAQPFISTHNEALSWEIPSKNGGGGGEDLW